MHLILMVAEKRLLMTAYAAMHQACTRRPIDSQSMTRAFIMSLTTLREQELSYSKPRAIDKPLRDTSMPKWIVSLDDQQYVYGADNKTHVNMERNGKKIAPYWLFLREYCSHLKSRNRRNDTYTLKRFYRAGRVVTTCRTTRLPSSSSYDASERVRPSRHIALTAMLDSGQLLGMSKKSHNYCNIRFLVGAWDTSSSPSTPIGPIRSITSVSGSFDWLILVDCLIFLDQIESLSTFELFDWTVRVVCLIFLNRFESFCLFRVI